MIISMSTLRQMGVLMLAVLPTISGQACTSESNCSGNFCCNDDGQCSTFESGSVLPGGPADDDCECSFNAISAEGICECTANGNCPDDLCCMENGQCSTLDTDAVLPGGTANDACECRFNILGDDGVCDCMLDGHCPDSKCCMDDGQCSPLDKGSLLPGETASDVCECAVNAISDGNICGCNFDGNCPDDLCCMDNGQCSPLVKDSVKPGGAADDVCECAHNLISDEGVCGCRFDGNCPDDACCMENDQCSTLDMGSVLPGGGASDACECLNTVLSDVGICGCNSDDQCDDGQICCPDKLICEDEPADGSLGACGDPHMTGFHGQKFDFTGKDGSWYSLVSDPHSMTVNMRITAPLPTVPAITYITGISIVTTDVDGFEHSVVISVKEPHSLESVCPMDVSPCLADGSLHVVVDGEEALSAPGNVVLAPGIEVTAVNIPGECRSFGFETYWERKKLERQQAGRRLAETENIGEWVLADPTATNMVECTQYVTTAMMQNGGMFDHQSEHASFKIVTPATTIRLTHGRLHQLATRDPTDRFDLPDHVAWQMNIAVDLVDVSHEAKGILGETVVPTRDANGGVIMHGMASIRGVQEDYAVEGPLGMEFGLDSYSMERH